MTLVGYLFQRSQTKEVSLNVPPALLVGGEGDCLGAFQRSGRSRDLQRETFQ